MMNAHAQPPPCLLLSLLSGRVLRYSTPSRRLERGVLPRLPALSLLCALLLSPLPALGAPAENKSTAALRLSPAEAVTRALRANLSLTLERQDVRLTDAAQRKADATFEPELFAAVDAGHSPGSVSSQRAGLSPTSSTNVGGELGVRKAFSTGTSVELSLSTRSLFGGGVLDPSHQSGATLTARQSLLSGISREANLSELSAATQEREQARLALQRKAEEVAAQTLAAYFDLHAALAKDRAQAAAEEVARTTFKETELLIAAGKLAGSEALAARYTLQVQQRARLQSKKAVQDARETLARLTGLIQPQALVVPALVTTETVTPLPGDEALAALQQAALKARGDYRAARQKVATARLRLRAAKHRTLPSLDLVGSVFLTGISGEPDPGASVAVEVREGYWASYQMDRVGWSLGLDFSLPLQNNAARAAETSAERALRQAETGAKLLLQQISEALGKAWRDLTLARDQLELSRTAEALAQQKLHNEEALYRAGKTTAHILASVQADATAEELARVQAEADLNKALVQLHSVAGTLLAHLRLPASG